MNICDLPKNERSQLQQLIWDDLDCILDGLDEDLRDAVANVLKDRIMDCNQGLAPGAQRLI